jgi:TonB-linked SusC/RagA family outer membrane protein
VITSGLLFNRNTQSSNSGNLDLSIRGRSTIYANDQPLIVLDNFPYNGDLNAINPNDVASITLLKDAAAASIWGVRAGNGVIVVTTKRGKYGQPLNVSLNSNVTISGKPDVFYNPNYLPSSDFIDVEISLFDQGRYDDLLNNTVSYPVVSPVVQMLDRQRKGELSSAELQKQLDALRDNDIRNEELKYFYRMPVSQQYWLSLSGGTARSGHYFSLGYDKETLSLKHNDDASLNINSQNTYKPVKNLEISAGVNYVRSVAAVDSTIRVTSGKGFIPYFEFKDAAGKPAVFEKDINAAYKSAALNQGFLNWDYVPLEELGRSPIKNRSNDLRLNAGLKYTFFDGLNAEVKYQYRHVAANSERFNDVKSSTARNIINSYSTLISGAIGAYPIPVGGMLDKMVSREVSQNVRWQLAYQKNWAKHSVSALAGYELSEYDTQANRRFYYGYNPATGSSVPVDSLTTFKLNPGGSGKISTGSDLFGVLDRVRSVFANAAYTYDYKYTLTGSMRIDGSNYFGVKTNQKNVPLWSAGALWHLDREAFYNLNWLPVLKLRVSYGYNGNLDRRNTGITTFRKNILGATFTNLPFASIINIGNPELRWEKIAIANFGVDFSLKNSVVAGKLEYYFKRGSDILGDKAFPSNSGITVLRGNYAKIAGHGFDLALTTQNLRGSLRWQTDFLFSAIGDRVTTYDMVEPNSLYYVGSFNNIPLLNRPIYGIYSYKSAGLDPTTGDPRGYLNGEISTDYVAILENGVSELEYHGTSRPTFFGSVNNTISYGRFTLGLNISAKLGYYFRKPSVNYSNMSNLGVRYGMSKDFEQRWKQPGDEQTTSVPSMPSNTQDSSRDFFFNNSSATVDKGDHIRLQDISLSFDLDNVGLGQVSIPQLQLYCYINNLGLIWKANSFGLDPDVIPRSDDRFTGTLPRSFSFGIKASL